MMKSRPRVEISISIMDWMPMGFSPHHTELYCWVCNDFSTSNYHVRSYITIVTDLKSRFPDNSQWLRSDARCTSLRPWSFARHFMPSPLRLGKIKMRGMNFGDRLIATLPARWMADRFMRKFPVFFFFFFFFGSWMTAGSPISGKSLHNFMGSTIWWSHSTQWSWGYTKLEDLFIIVTRVTKAS